MCMLGHWQQYLLLAAGASARRACCIDGAKLGDEVRAKGAAFALNESVIGSVARAAEGSLLWESARDSRGDTTEAKTDPYS